MMQYMIIKIAEDDLGECDGMLQRVVTSLVSLAIFFAIIFCGEAVFNAAVCVIAAGILFELYKAMNVGKALTTVGRMSAVIVIAGCVFGCTMPAVILTVMLFLILTVFLHGKIEFKQVYSTALVTLYVAMFMSCIILLRIKSGIFGVLPIFICAWMTDVGAYFAGYFFGKHKLIPAVSPKKTVEGAVGGVISAVLSCLIYGVIVKIGFGKEFLSYTMLALLAAAASVFSQLGDLIASVVKRECGIKDFGTIFPGHGGILDRFDSVIFIAPLVYYFMLMFS